LYLKPLANLYVAIDREEYVPCYKNFSCSRCKLYFLSYQAIVARSSVFVFIVSHLPTPKAYFI